MVSSCPIRKEVPLLLQIEGESRTTGGEDSGEMCSQCVSCHKFFYLENDRIAPRNYAVGSITGVIPRE